MNLKFYLFQIAILCAIWSSCTAEETIEQNQNEVPVSNSLSCQLSFQIPQSRVAANTADFYNLYYAVYDKASGNLVLSNTDKPQKLENSDKWQEVEIPLTIYKDKVYDIALWAHPENARYADISDLTDILIDYSQEIPVGLTAHFPVTSAQTVVTDMLMKNPFSRVRICSSEKDAEAAINSQYDFTQITSTLELNNIGTSYNALAGKVNQTAKGIFVNDRLTNSDFEPIGNKLLMDVCFLPVEYTTTGTLTVATDYGQGILRTT